VGSKRKQIHLVTEADELQCLLFCQLVRGNISEHLTCHVSDPGHLYCSQFVGLGNNAMAVLNSGLDRYVLKSVIKPADKNQYSWS
jgi:hypothetical protein